MKRKILAVILAVLTLGAVLVSCGGGAQMRMGTGGTGGTYYAFGGVLSQYIKNNAGINCVAVSTEGSKANIQGVASGDYQLGTVQSDVMAYAWDGTNTFAKDGRVDGFRVIGGLYGEAVQVVTMDSSIKSIADLKGKSVSIGAPGSGVYFNAIDMLTAAGLTENDITAQYLSFNDSADGLKDGKIRRGVHRRGSAYSRHHRAHYDDRRDPRSIDGEIADKVMANCPYYTKYTIPAGTYNGQETDIVTVAVKATLIVAADTDEETVYNITKAIFDNAEAIAAENAKGAEGSR